MGQNQRRAAGQIVGQPQSPEVRADRWPYIYELSGTSLWSTWLTRPEATTETEKAEVQAEGLDALVAIAHMPDNLSTLVSCASTHIEVAHANVHNKLGYWLGKLVPAGGKSNACVAPC